MCSQYLQSLVLYNAYNCILLLIIINSFIFLQHNTEGRAATGGTSNLGEIDPLPVVKEEPRNSPDETPPQTARQRRPVNSLKVAYTAKCYTILELFLNTKSYFIMLMYDQ